MTAGPTQSYGEQAPSVQWRPRPVLATLVRISATLGPVLVALALGAAAAHWLPAERLGLPGLAWLLLVVALSTAVLFGLSRWFRRLVPLSALLRLSLVVPDKVPSRFAVARRTWSPTALPRDAAGGAGDWLLTLVGTLAAHDDRTRAHGERVQAYAALIGREMGMPAQDVERLSWVALLHDVGKVHVPVEVINKNGRPTAQEWACLQQHPAHGDDLVAPLRGWLGDWLDGVVQHHERWDGRGYPAGLAGTGISLAARVIAVADTYDVITSARSYKRPLTAEQARAELTRCAGTQFDPDVVRALLGVGIGRLRFVAGPTTLLASLPGVGSAPAQAASGLSAAAQTAGGHLLGAVLTASLGVGTGALATGAVADVLPAQVAQAAVGATGAEPAGPGPGAPLDGPVEGSPGGFPGTAAPSASAVPTVDWTPLAGGLDPFRPLSAAAGAGGGLGAGTGGAAGGVPTGTPTGSPATPTAVPTAGSTTAPTLVVQTAPSSSSTASSTASSTTTSSTPAPTPSPPPGGGAGGAPSPTTGPGATTSPTTAPTTGPTTSPTTAPTSRPTTSPTTTGAPTPTGTGSPTSTSPTTTSPTTTSPTTTSPTTTRPPTTSPTTSPTTGSPTSSPTSSPSPSAGSDCARAVAGDRDLRGARLERCGLSGLSLAGRDLRGAQLTGATLNLANLTGADLRGASLDGASLVRTDLTGADLRGASFRGALFVLPTLTGARYDGSTFTGALGLALP